MSREAFEALISENDEHPRACMKDPDGKYAYPSVRNAYFIWQAARAAALEEAAQLCESQCAGISYANGNLGPCLTEFPKECGGRHDGMTYADAIRALKEPQ